MKDPLSVLYVLVQTKFDWKNVHFHDDVCKGTCHEKLSRSFASNVRSWTASSGKLCLSHCTESYPKKQFQHLSKYDGLPQRAMVWTRWGLLTDCYQHCSIYWFDRETWNIVNVFADLIKDNLLLGGERKFVIPLVPKTEWYLSGQVKSTTVAWTFGQHSVDTSGMGLLGIVSSNSSVGWEEE